MNSSDRTSSRGSAAAAARRTAAARTGDPGLVALAARTGGLQPWRRLFHAGSGLAVAGLLVWAVPDRGVHLPMLAGATVAAFLLDLVRLRFPTVNRLFFRAFARLASPREVARPASSSWYALGLLLTVALFPMDAAVSAILVLALADPAASVVGRLHGGRRLGKGSVIGSLAFLGVAAPLLMLRGGVAGGLLAAVLTTVAEVSPLRLDDNLVVPVVAGASLMLAGALGL